MNRDVLHSVPVLSDGFKVSTDFIFISPLITTPKDNSLYKMAFCLFLRIIPRHENAVQSANAFLSLELFFFAYSKWSSHF